MAVLQRSTKVDVPIGDVGRRWHDFEQMVALTNPVTRKRSDSGTVYFTRAADGTTEVTFQIDPGILGLEEQAVLTHRVASYLDRFKSFAETRR